MWHTRVSGCFGSVFEEPCLQSSQTNICLGEDNGNHTDDTGRPSDNFKSFHSPDGTANVRQRRR
jgi:hypothetical protein